MLLDKLLSNLAVHVEPFALCTLSTGWRLCLPGPPGVMFHFVLQGSGAVRGPDSRAIPMAPSSLVVVPAGAKHVLESRAKYNTRSGSTPRPAAIWSAAWSLAPPRTPS